MPAEPWPGDLIAQEYVEGFPASVACLIGPAGFLLLVPCEQIFSADGRFHYQGGRLPIAPDLAARAATIAKRAVESIPGLFGYVGMDVVLGSDGRDWAIEVNPRLTTSYVGLRRLAVTNLFGAVLAAVRGESPPISWRPGMVEFSPAGEVKFQTPRPNPPGV